MIQMYFSFFNVDSIRGFTSTFVAICYATLHLFGFTSRSKHPPLDILKFLVTTLINQDKKVAFVRVDADEELEGSSESMKTCHQMYIILQTTGADAPSLNDNSKIPNTTLANIKLYLLLKSIHKK